MALYLTLIGVIIITCVLLNNASSKLGIPVLLAFLLLGIALGSTNAMPFKIEDFELAEKICSSALIFIMFYGGFGTNWNSAKGVALEAGLLASVGVIMTAGLTGVFCHFALKWGWIESFLMGSVISSTDAASVFSILRSRKLGLKNNTVPLLEIESGSNDPFSYMLTAIMLSLLNAGTSGGHIAWLVFSQIAFGAGFGVLFAWVAVWAMRRISFATKGFDSLFIFAIAIISYAIPCLIGGNGYLSAYIVGIIMGNNEFRGRKDQVHFFDGFTGLMQVLIFFLLGLLARPALMNRVILPALAIFGIMILVARPVSVALVLTPFRKYGFRQQTLISFVGLRGAASIVFAIMATVGNSVLQNDLLNIVFCIVLLSIALQGTLIPFVAGKLGMIDENMDVMTTFSDFAEETDIQFSQLEILADSPWCNKRIMDLGTPRTLRFCSLIHKDGAAEVPVGSSMLRDGDTLIICSKTYSSRKELHIVQHEVRPSSKWIGHQLKEYPARRSQVLMIQRKSGNVIPSGSTVIQSGDILFINES